VYSPNDQDQADRNAVEVLRFAPRFRQASKAIAFLVSVLGLVVFCGWVFNVPSLTYIRPTLQSMKVNTTLSFLCLGAGLWLADNDDRQGIRRILGLLVIIIGGSTLAEYAFHISLGIDQLLLRDTRTPSLSAYPGRMAIATAICFLFLGSAVMLLGLRKAIALQRSLVAACFALSLTALCGYLYGVKSLYSITSYSTMGVHTSAGLMAVCLAYFLARPNEGIVSIAASDSNSGFLLRTLVPAIVVVPILIGWLSLLGHRTDLYDTPFGAPLVVLASIGCLAVLTILVARSMYRWECESFHAGKTIHETNRALEAQAALLQSREELLKIFVKSVPAGVAMLDRDMRYLQVSDRWCADYSVDSSQVLGRSHYELFPYIPQSWKEMHRRALEGEALRADEDRWDREGGTTTWVRWEIHPWRTPSGIVGGILIFAEDITHRKQMEEAISGMSRKLIESQEQERVRIGRELHDDIGQRLAMSAIELQQVHADPAVLPEVRSRMGELQKQISEIAVDIQSLLHELHSSKLEYLGVAFAMRSFCKEFAEQQKVEIDFQTHDLPSPVPPDISLCLFRVLQEALHNSVKHSGVRRFEARLWGTSGQIDLMVQDSGVGFDSEAAKKSRGLGLISMQERVKLVKGTFSIESQPRRGTTIHARVPLSSGSDSIRAAG